MRIGADYYPEHWDKSRWEEDARLMGSANIKVIRVGEFAWSLFEPKDGNYDFTWMDEAIEFFGKKGINVVLGTPSATPPKWLIDKYPDILQVSETGQVKHFGTRKHYCFNSDVYREKTRKLVEAMAKHYSGNPYIEGWQIDNELGHSDTVRCYCEKCRVKFVDWLQEKYGTVESLNSAYGTVFWSQKYDDFSQLILPRAGTCYSFDEGTRGQNPSLLLDYYRFCSDSIISFAQESINAIREYDNKPCSSNLLDASVNSETGIDYFELSKKLDYVTWDNYIEFQWGRADMAAVSKDHALMRSYKKQPFWVMEQQSGPCGWSRMGSSPVPGDLRIWTYEAIANGADTVVYFRWRACTFGTEQYWHGILGHDGKPNRRYEEIKQVGDEMQRLNEKVGTLMPKAKVAIIKSFITEWCHKVFPNVEDFQYDKVLLSFYRPFYNLGISVDFIDGEESFDEYELVLAPALAYVSDVTRVNLEKFEKQGGTIITTFRSGYRNMNNCILEETLPGPLAEISGVEVSDYDPQFQKETSVSGVFGTSKANLWCDVLEQKNSEVLGEYIEGYYKGKPCLTRKGTVYYLGCDLDQSGYNEFIKYVLEESTIEGTEIREGVESISTTDGTRDFRFIINYNNYDVFLPIKNQCTEILTDKRISKIIKVAAHDLVILTEE